MAAIVPLKRKLEIALAGYLLDQQTADPTFLRLSDGGLLPIVCGTTGRSPDDQTPFTGEVIEPELPYLSVGCAGTKPSASFGVPGYGIREGSVHLWLKTQANDTARAVADAWLIALDETLADLAVVAAALNPPSDGTPDTRRQTALYVYFIGEPESGDDHTEQTFEDEIIYPVLCQGFDPDPE